MAPGKRRSLRLSHPAGRSVAVDAGGEPRSKKFKIRDFFSFNKEFAVLIRTGMPIVAALDAIIEKSEPSELNNILQQVRYDVSTGESLSDAFAKYPRIFSNLYISSLQAGEKSGNIPEALIKHVAYLKQMMALRRKLISASVYPLILVTASVAVLFLLLIYVVPALRKPISRAAPNCRPSPWC